MKLIDILKPVTAAGIVGLAGLLQTGCGKSPGERYSTSNARVSQLYGNDSLLSYYNVDFKDFGNYEDAALALTPNDKGGYDLAVNIKLTYTMTEVVQDDKGRVLDAPPSTTFTGGQFGDFDRSTTDARTIETDVHNLLEEAHKYVQSPQYSIDLKKRLEPTVEEGHGIKITRFYTLEK